MVVLGSEGKSLYDVMLEHPNRLASKSYIELAYMEVDKELRLAELKLGYALENERKRLDSSKTTWRFMTRSNIYNCVQALIGTIKTKCSDVV